MIIYLSLSSSVTDQSNHVTFKDDRIHAFDESRQFSQPEVCGEFITQKLINLIVMVMMMMIMMIMIMKVIIR